MDALVLIRVAAALHDQLVGSALRDIVEESPTRLRLVFLGADPGPRTVLLSLRPGSPWIGRPARRSTPGRAVVRTAFFAECRRALRGGFVAGVEQLGADRVVTVRFADGHALAAELQPNAANLVLIDPAGSVIGAHRSTGTSRARLAAGAPYQPPPRPRDRLDPFSCGADDFARLLESGMRAGIDAAELLRKRVFGLGSDAARLVLRDAAAAGRPIAEVLARRFGQLRRGEVDPVVEGPVGQIPAAARGDLDLSRTHLLPWEPWRLDDGSNVFRESDPAATAGRFHEAAERAAEQSERGLALRAILDAELRRVGNAIIAVDRDIRGFEDPERHRRWGEAILAGLRQARRLADAIIVPDPYSAAGDDIVIPVDPGVGPTQAAEACFQRHRRAVRGLARANERRLVLQERRARLERIASRFQEPIDPADADALDAELRAERIPLPLPSRQGERGRSAAPTRRIAGVRLFTTVDGHSVMVGRSGRDNQYLTFRLAAADDLWLHAQDVSGAHVVLRDASRAGDPPRPALDEAAAIAAWFSDARDAEWVEVQWTRRKNVRKARGAPPGTVVLKRFRTIRVRPGLPPGQTDV